MHGKNQLICRVNIPFPWILWVGCPPPPIDGPPPLGNGSGAGEGVTSEAADGLGLGLGETWNPYKVGPVISYKWSYGTPISREKISPVS